MVVEKTLGNTIVGHRLVESEKVLCGEWVGEKRNEKGKGKRLEFHNDIHVYRVYCCTLYTYNTCYVPERYKTRRIRVTPTLETVDAYESHFTVRMYSNNNNNNIALSCVRLRVRKMTGRVIQKKINTRRPKDY